MYELLRIAKYSDKLSAWIKTAGETPALPGAIVTIIGETQQSMSELGIRIDSLELFHEGRSLQV
jgi:hypothetical protein